MKLRRYGAAFSVLIKTLNTFMFIYKLLCSICQGNFPLFSAILLIFHLSAEEAGSNTCQLLFRLSHL